MSAQEVAQSVPEAFRALPCPFCGGMAEASKMFPQFQSSWFVSVDHASDCELAEADGGRRCHANQKAAVRSWNTRHNPTLHP